MEIQVVLDYFSMYGYFFLFGIVFLEYMNFPGLPAGVIMPASGILVSQADMQFGAVLIISVIAGVCGSLVLYFIGRVVGDPSINWLTEHFQSTKKPIQKTIDYLEKHGNRAIFIARLLPVIRTIISLPAGAFKVEFVSFVIYSALGITLWNFAYIYAGYAFSDFFLSS